MPYDKLIGKRKFTSKSIKTDVKGNVISNFGIFDSSNTHGGDSENLSIDDIRGK